MAGAPPINVRQLSAEPQSVIVAWDPPVEMTGLEYEYRLDSGVPVSVGASSWITISGFEPGETKELQVRILYPEGITEPIGPVFGPPEEGEWSEPLLLKTKIVRRIQWNVSENRRFESGLDRGILYPEGADAVVWEGLISVDQTGGEEMTPYFMDGRPYLYFPQPREYESVIKAYTYPDEFSAAMGLPEVSDGLYLDSQIGEQFGLSYRTLIGNSTSGLDYAYKIHIVYNAAVATESISYQSLSSSTEPTEFGFQIAAVPVPFPGHRPTAHVALDTRHLSANKLKRIEDILYGDGVTEARLPTPEELFDILNLSESLVVTDNGDGTWTVEGPYDNIQVQTNGYFKILNINSEDRGDGSYTISTTSV